SVVRRTVVHYHDLSGVGLRDDAFDCLGQEMSLSVARNDNGYRGVLHDSKSSRGNVVATHAHVILCFDAQNLSAFFSLLQNTHGQMKAETVMITMCSRPAGVWFGWRDCNWTALNTKRRGGIEVFLEA